MSYSNVVIEIEGFFDFVSNDLYSRGVQMRYPQEAIEEVRAGNDIVDVVGGYVALKSKGGKLFGLCPFHNEKSPSFSVSSDKQMYYCFG